MVPVYPPHGPQDMERFRRLKREEREYLRFSLEFCSDILLKRPEQTEALELAANHFTALGFYTDGLLLDQRLARIRPEDPNVQYNLACSFALVGHHDDALYALKKAVGYGYRDHRHMERDEDLAGLRHNPEFEELIRSVRERRKTPE